MDLLSLTARYAGHSIRLAGNIEGIGALTQRLSTGAAFNAGFEKVDDPDPYEGSLERLEVSPADGPVLIERRGAVLVVEGATEYLRNLGQEIESVLGSVKLPAHTHIEYYPGHFFLREGALSLVVVAED